MPPPTHKSTAATHDLKQRVLTILDRLSDRDTFTQSSNELELIVRSLPQDSSSSSALSTFLTCLLSVDDSPHHKPAARAHSLRLISSLAALHPSSLSPYVPKILSTSILRRLRDPDSSVRLACVHAASSLALHTTSPFASILDPLQSALSSDQDLNVQIGAAMCLSAAIDAASASSVDAGELRRLLPKMVKLATRSGGDGFKAKSAVWGLIGSVVAAGGGSVVNGRGLMGSVVEGAVEALGSQDWAVRKAAAEALERVATAVEDREVVAEAKRVCVESLEKRRFDKVKNAREAMNRALEAWKEVPGEDDSILSGSNFSSPSKGPYFSHGVGHSPTSNGHNHRSPGTPLQHKKKLTKSRSSVSDCSTVTSSSPLISKSCTDTTTSSETPPQSKKKYLSKSRSSLSSVSSVSDNDSTLSIPKGWSSPSIPRKKKSSSPGSLRNLGARKSSQDWKIEIVVPRGDSSSSEQFNDCVVGKSSMDFFHASSGENDSNESDESETMRSNFIRGVSEEERVNESSDSLFGSPLVVPSQEEEDEVDSEPEVVDMNGRVQEEVYGNGAEFEDLAMIRKQLVHIEKQQSHLMGLLQSFMGSSQNGINSLETRVSGLEKALDGISNDLALQSGRIPNNESTSGNSCCMIPGAEFLSPKFWKKNEGRFAVTRPMLSRDAFEEAAEKVDGGRSHQLNEVNPQSDFTKESKRNLEVNSNRPKANAIPQNSFEARDYCSGNSGGAFSPTCYTQVVHRT